MGLAKNDRMAEPALLPKPVQSARTVEPSHTQASVLWNSEKRCFGGCDRTKGQAEAPAQTEPARLHRAISTDTSSSHPKHLDRPRHLKCYIITDGARLRSQFTFDATPKPRMAVRNLQHMPRQTWRVRVNFDLTTTGDIDRNADATFRCAIFRHRPDRRSPPIWRRQTGPVVLGSSAYTASGSY